MLQDAIRELRKKHNLSQVQFAKRLNVTQGAVSQWEKGATRPDTDMLARIYSEFGTTIDELMQGEVKKTTDIIRNRPLTDEVWNRNEYLYQVDGSCKPENDSESL